MKRLTLSLLALGGLLSGCTFGPSSGGVLASKNSQVTVWGYTAEAGRSVGVECQSGASEPWISAGTIVSGNTTFSQAGETGYQFNGRIVLPATCWSDSTLIVAGVGAVYWTNLRTIDNETGQQHLHWFPAGTACLIAEVQGGAGPKTAAETCALEPDNLSGSGVTLFAP